MNKEELLSELEVILEREDEIRGKLNLIEVEERFSAAQQLEGRYFKELSYYPVGHVRCLSYYGVDREENQPMVLIVEYRAETSFFEIFSDLAPQPIKIGDKPYEWVEIDKEEFMEHYTEVQKRISACVAVELNKI